MLTLKTISDNPTEVIEKLAKKHFDGKEIIYQVLDIDKKRRETQNLLDNCLAEVNTLSKSVGGLMKEGKKDEADKIRYQVSNIKEDVKQYESSLKDLEQNLQDLLVIIPNHFSIIFKT